MYVLKDILHFVCCSIAKKFSHNVDRKHLGLTGFIFNNAIRKTRTIRIQCHVCVKVKHIMANCMLSYLI